MANPNEYDDDRFLTASNELQNNLPAMLDDLYYAGASATDIESELANALENTDMQDSRLLGTNVAVSITGLDF